MVVDGSQFDRSESSDVRQNAIQFVYSFTASPDEKWKFDRAVFELFRVMGGRAELEFTQDEFERFRSGLSHHGIVLHEVTRIPYHEPQPIF